MTALNASVAQGFAATYGTAPDGLWSAPGRVNLIGEHTDYNEGFVLPFAIEARTAVAASRRDDGVLAVASAQYPGDVATIPLADTEAAAAPATVEGWPAYVAGVAWALTQASGGTLARGGRLAGERTGVSLYIGSRVPEGSGLSSSAALECAVGCALNDLWRAGASRAELARVCQRAENEVVGAPTGIMDQFASLFGEAGGAVFLDCRSITGEIVPLPLARAGLSILLADTGERHAHAAGGYASRRASCERAARALGVRALRDLSTDDLATALDDRALDDETFRRARHVVTENERVLATVRALRAGALTADPVAVGALLTASHESMRDDFEITTPALDLAAATAVEAGAFGARMTGGGFGGAILALVARDRVHAVGEAITAALSRGGHAPPSVRTVSPSDGANHGMSQSKTMR
ncbi:MAG: galactokinase [Actinobacteria bacterium]|nr:galactokinase [Actinomycetota bacterium]